MSIKSTIIPTFVCNFKIINLPRMISMQLHSQKFGEVLTSSAH